MPNPDKNAEKRERDERLSLHPLTTEEALRAFLQVKPPEKTDQKRGKKQPKQ